MWQPAVPSRFLKNFVKTPHSNCNIWLRNKSKVWESLWAHLVENLKVRFWINILNKKQKRLLWFGVEIYSPIFGLVLSNNLRPFLHIKHKGAYFFFTPIFLKQIFEKVPTIAFNLVWIQWQLLKYSKFAEKKDNFQDYLYYSHSTNFLIELIGKCFCVMNIKMKLINP